MGRANTARARLRAVAAAALLVCVCMPAGAQNRDRLFEYETKHYRVETDVSAGFTRLVGAHMEEILGEYSRRFEGYGQAGRPFRVKVFRSEEGYRKAVSPEVWGSTGVFIPSERLLAAHRENRTVEEVLRTLYHEGFHQFMFEAVSPRCPVWLNEGLAEYFSESTWNGRGFTTGQVPTLRLRIIRDAVTRGDYVPFRDLFALSPARWVQDARTSQHRADLYYCQSWSIVHFLVHADGGRHADMLNRLIGGIAAGDDPEEVIQQVFGEDVAAFEQAWARYVLSLRPSPKFVCRDNMEALMLLAGQVYNDPDDLRSVKDLRTTLLRGGRLRWELTRPGGEKIGSEDTDKVKALFRCPTDPGGRDAAYLVVRNRRSGLPMLVYDDLPGIIIMAYHESPGRPGARVVVEEVVRETAGADFLRAVQVARREQL